MPSKIKNIDRYPCVANTSLTHTHIAKSSISMLALISDGFDVIPFHHTVFIAKRKKKKLEFKYSFSIRIHKEFKYGICDLNVTLLPQGN